jgi:hypothetical protein
LPDLHRRCRIVLAPTPRLLEIKTMGVRLLLDDSWQRSRRGVAMRDAWCSG